MSFWSLLALGSDLYNEWMTLENYSDFGVRDLFESIHNKAKNFIKSQLHFRTPKWLREFLDFLLKLRICCEMLGTFFVITA